MKQVIIPLLVLLMSGCASSLTHTSEIEGEAHIIKVDYDFIEATRVIVDTPPKLPTDLGSAIARLRNTLSEQEMAILRRLYVQLKEQGLNEKRRLKVNTSTRNWKIIYVDKKTHDVCLSAASMDSPPEIHIRTQIRPVVICYTTDTQLLLDKILIFGKAPARENDDTLRLWVALGEPEITVKKDGKRN